MTASECHGTRAERLDQLVSKSQGGDVSARRQMEAFVYRELRRLASTYMNRDRNPDVWAIAGLVNETITRIAGAKLEFEDQHHFYATAARVMRRVLVDYAKTRRASRRGGITFD
ncbi:MAG TPA: ECF-type sigma factor, partial [Steroidobacteraceae bacterium]|nr:ECF-type sigma factor [Steroidobacteraceae bacterium]